MIRFKRKQEEIYAGIKEFDALWDSNGKAGSSDCDKAHEINPWDRQRFSTSAMGVAPKDKIYILETGPTVMELAYIPPGSFIMGSPPSEPGRNSDEAPHQVTISTGFYLQTTLITQQQWSWLMGCNPAHFSKGSDRRPMERVSWYECREFLAKLETVHEGTFRLPTEAEWEYACRAGTNTAFANGGIAELFCESDLSLAKVGWYCGNSGGESKPVAQKEPNGWGIFDMHGNLFEWCQDFYGEYTNVSSADPVAIRIGPGRVIRGGYWFSPAKNCRSANRSYWPPESRSDFIGFRVLRELS